MDKWIKPIGILLGLIVGGYLMYVANLDGSKPLDAGNTALRDDRYDEAIAHFNDVFEELQRSAKVPIFAVGLTMEKQEHRYEAFKGLAKAYLAKGEPERARENHDWAYSINSYDPMLTLLAVKIAEARGDPQAAEEALGRLLDTNPNYYGNYLLRARLRGRMGDCRGQIADYRAALRNLNAGHLLHERIDVVMDLSWLLASHPEARCRDGVYALGLLNETAEVVDERYTDEARSRFLAIRAAALAETGDYAGAKDSAERAAALLPPDSKQFAALQRQLNAYNIKEPWRESQSGL